MKKDTESLYKQALQGLIERYPAETHERFPELASGRGLAQYNARLGTNDKAAYRAQIQLVAQTLADVEKLPEATFVGEDWLDRRIFLALLRTEFFQMQTLSTWRINPQIHCDTAIEALFDLFVRHREDLSSVLPAIEARLIALPAFLAAGVECVKRPIPLWVQLAERACEGAVGFLEEIAPEVLRMSEVPERMERALRGARKAFEAYAAAIGRKRPGPEHGYCVGREHFEFLLRERLGLNLSLPEAMANGERLIAQTEHLLAEEAHRHGGRNARQILEDAAEAWTPTQPLLTIYRETTERVKKRLRQLEIVTLPRGETLQVLPTPPFLRHQFPTAAYTGPQPFASLHEGIFWVNDLSLTQTDSRKQKAEIQQHFGLELTCVHEAYPGHHLQFAIQNQHPHLLRRLAGHSIFYEGWTMWCEKIAVEHGLVTQPLARLQHLHDTLWRAYRIVIDCGLHEGSLRYPEACKMLQKGVQFTQARAEADVNWYTSAPTVPMSYLLGRLEVEKLYRRFVKREGWTLKVFHRWLLSHGAVPLSWIVQAHDQ